MGSRVELDTLLRGYLPPANVNIYYQPPNGMKLNYPCIIYNKIPKSKEYANNRIYASKQGYQLTVISKNPDETIADDLESNLEYCSITNLFVKDNLYHTILNIYY